MFFNFLKSLSITIDPGDPQNLRDYVDNTSNAVKDVIESLKDNSMKSEIVKRIDGTFQQHRLFYLRAMKQIPITESLSDVLRDFRSKKIPVGVIKRVRATEAEVEDALQSDVLNRVRFEISMKRIQGTDEWMVVKGLYETVDDRTHVPNGVNGEVEVPDYLFDIDIHSHTNRANIRPSSLDIDAFYERNNGRQLRFMIRTSQGINVVSVQGLADMDHPKAMAVWTGILDKFVETVKQVRPQAVRNEERGEIDINDPVANAMWLKVIDSMIHQGLLQMHFYRWGDSRLLEEFKPIKENTTLSDNLSSTNSGDRKRALNVLIRLMPEFDSQFQLDLLRELSRSATEQEALVIIRQIIPLVAIDLRDDAYRLFSNTELPLINALVSLYFEDQHSLNNTQAGIEYFDFFNQQEARRLTPKLNEKIHTMFVGSLRTGLLAAMNLNSDEIKESGESTLWMYLLRLYQVGLQRGSNNDPLVRAAIELRDQWGIQRDFAMNAFQRLSGIKTRISSLINESLKRRGGIDLNTKNMGMTISREGKGVVMKFDPRLIRQFKAGNFSGVIATILRITPIQNPVAVFN